MIVLITLITQIFNLAIKKFNSTIKNFQKNASIYNISIISRYGKNQENCGQVCVQTVSEPESTEGQSVNLPTEVTVSSVNEASPCNSSEAAPADNESDSDSTDGYSGGNRV
jgi:hypothetical protein